MLNDPYVIRVNLRDEQVQDLAEKKDKLKIPNTNYSLLTQAKVVIYASL